MDTQPRVHREGVLRGRRAFRPGLALVLLLVLVLPVRFRGLFPKLVRFSSFASLVGCGGVCLLTPECFRRSWHDDPFALHEYAFVVAVLRPRQ